MNIKGGMDVENDMKQPTAQEELAYINQFTKSPLTAEEVYFFPVRLCDNEVDRDFERFDRAALEKLGELFLGKSGLFDHQWSAQGQTARIYRTEVVVEPARQTAAGDEYCWLKGWAYLLRTEKNRDLIAEIEGGIKKGQTYGEQLCFLELQDPTDAYEWSFVAVPAQRNAGVVKRFGPEDGQMQVLRKQAELGRKYLHWLRREVVRLAMLADDGLDGQVFAGVAEKLEEPELLELRKTYEARVNSRFPASAQLCRQPRTPEKHDESMFLV